MKYSVWTPSCIPWKVIYIKRQWTKFRPTSIIYPSLVWRTKQNQQATPKQVHPDAQCWQFSWRKHGVNTPQCQLPSYHVMWLKWVTEYSWKQTLHSMFTLQEWFDYKNKSVIEFAMKSQCPPWCHRWEIPHLSSVSEVQAVFYKTNLRLYIYKVYRKQKQISCLDSCPIRSQSEKSPERIPSPELHAVSW